MTKEFDNTNRGVLFNNIEDKREGKKDPDYRGRIDVDGTEYWLAGWINVAQKTGKRFLSLKVTPMEPRRTAGNGAQAGGPEYSDEIPF